MRGMRRTVMVMAIAIAGGVTASVTHADVLLIPDSGNDRIWAFDPVDGAVLSEAYVPADGNMMQPINAVDSGAGTILVSDENADAVFEYGYDGQFLRTVVGGLDALQGLDVRDGVVYVGSRTGRVIHRVDLDGSGLAVWARAGVGTPRDVAFRVDDALTTNSDSESSGGENIERFDLDGDFLGTWHDSNGVDGIDFPQQIKIREDGGALVAGFSAPFGLYVYDADGNEVAAFTNLITSPRGVHELDDGRILYAGGTRVMRYDPETGQEETIVNRKGTSFRYIERSAAPRPCREDLDGSGAVDFGDILAILSAWGSPGGPEDLDGSGTVDFADLLVVLSAWGPCP